MSEDSPCEYLTPMCCWCGERTRHEQFKRCDVCLCYFCDWCYEDHKKECEDDNSQFGVGA